MTDQLKEQQENLQYSEQLTRPQHERSSFEMRTERMAQIDQELKDFHHQAASPEEVQQIQAQRQKEFQSKIAEIEGGIGITLSEESTRIIHEKMVEGVIEHAQKQNVRFDALTDERERLTLYTNLELGENPDEAIDKARAIITMKDTDGSKIKAFEKAMEYFGKPKDLLVDTPIYHSTGSYGLAKILEHGALESKKNVATGEQAATGEDIETTSFVIGGYDQSETVSYFYARKNERQNKLVLDKKDITGTGCEEDIVKTVFAELPKLDDEEQEQVRSAVQKLKGEREISDEDLMIEKMRGLQERKYYFDPEQAKKKLAALHEELRILQQENDQWSVKQEIAKLENGIRTYTSESPEMQHEMTDPFPTILVYEGKNLPEEDLTTLTSGLVSERRTKQPIENSQLKQIQVPENEMSKVAKWLKAKIDSLPPESPEQTALRKVKIVPLEFFEAKSIVKAS